jgi:hypothetical protein
MMADKVTQMFLGKAGTGEKKKKSQRTKRVNPWRQKADWGLPRDWEEALGSH